MNLSALGAAFLLIFLSEMGDKTQLVAVSLASRYDHKTIFVAVASALILATVLGVVAGAVLFSFIPTLWIRIVASVLFIFFGIWTLLEKEKEEDDEITAADGKVFNKAFSLTFLAEMGDKTQLTAIALTASLMAPVEVFLGASIGFLVITAIGVGVGKLLGKKLNQDLLKKGGGILFLVLGAIMLLEAVL